jgi:hypothetical protein
MFGINASVQLENQYFVHKYGPKSIFVSIMKSYFRFLPIHRLNFGISILRKRILIFDFENLCRLIE